MHPVHSSMSRRTSSGIRPRATMSATASRPPGFNTRYASLEHAPFVGRKVDHAVRYHDVDRSAGERDVLHLALQELDVFHAGLLLIRARDLEHLVGHIETVRLSRRADAPGREDHVDTAAGSEIEDDFARLELGERGRVAAAERGERRFERNVLELGVVVEIRGDRVLGARRARGAIAAARARRSPPSPSSSSPSDPRRKPRAAPAAPPRRTFRAPVS